MENDIAAFGCGPHGFRFKDIAVDVLEVQPIDGERAGAFPAKHAHAISSTRQRCSDLASDKAGRPGNQNPHSPFS